MSERLPAGEVRRSPDGVTVVCLGSEWDNRWKVIGRDPMDLVLHGWRADRHVQDWTVMGSVYDLTPDRARAPFGEAS